MVRNRLTGLGLRGAGAFVTLVVVIAGGGSAAKAAVPWVLGGASSSLAPNSDAWSWDGADIAGYRGAVANAAYFGPSGIVHTTISPVTLSTISPSTLSGLNGFIAPYFYNGDSAAYNTMIVNFFLAGGNLFLLDDASNYDGIAAALGIPTIDGSAGSLSNGGAPMFVGPFGTTSNVTQSFTVGYLSMANVLAHGGFACATNASSQITAACFPAGAYAAGSGGMIITGDVDMISSAGTATYSPLNANGTWALNGTAWLVGGAPAVLTTPAPPGTPAPPAILLTLLGLSGLAFYFGSGRFRRTDA